MAVNGHEAKHVERILGKRCHYGLQKEQLATNHTVLVVRDAVDALNLLPQTVLVWYDDTPLFSSDVFARLLHEHNGQQATVTFLTAATD